MTMLDPRALETLKSNQRQLDADGCEVSVSRQALEELTAAYEALSTITPAEVGGLVERLRGIPVKWIDLRMGEEAADAIEALTAAISAERAAHAETKRALDEAIKAAGDQATLRGEAEGKLAASEMAGIVDGWKRRAEAYRTQRDEALKAQNYLKDAVLCGLSDQEIARRARLLVEATRRALTGGQEDG